MTNMTWSDLNFIGFLKDLNSDESKVSEEEQQAVGDKGVEFYNTTLASLIYWFNFLWFVKNQFEHPLSKIKTDLAHEIINFLPEYSTEEKKVIRKLEHYVNKIKWVQENFQISVFRHDAFHYNEFAHLIKVFPSWDCNKIRIYLNISKENTTFSTTDPSGQKTEYLDSLKPDLDKITNLLTTQFRNNLGASLAANGIMSSIIELLENQSKKARTRKGLFKKFDGILNEMNDMIVPADELNAAIRSLFTNIGSIAGSIANLLHQKCHLEHSKYFLKNRDTAKKRMSKYSEQVSSEFLN